MSAGVPTGGGSPAFPASRLRRLRRTPAVRRLVAETRVNAADLVLPLFVKEGIDEPHPVPSMPGVVQHTRDSLRVELARAAAAGIGGVLLFAVPAAKDARGSQADAPTGIAVRSIADAAAEVGDDLVVMADLCLDEYTDHGHCGLLSAEGAVDNDATLVRYAEVACAQASAGAAVVAPSGMMDGQVGAVRTALDKAGFTDVAILAYAAKYASALYGPFRDAAECAPRTGDRATYQQDPANANEAIREVVLDVQEGADAVMVKPAGGYLDIVRRVREAVGVPVAAYQVSGEYAMIEAAARNGWLDRRRAVLESLTGIRRAGAGVVATYWAVEVARWLG